MITSIFKTVALAVALTAGTAASAAQFLVELAEPLTGEDTASLPQQNISEVERLDAVGKSYIVLDAKDEAALTTFFDARDIEPLEIKAVGFVNGPEIGGGVKAGASPQPGHQTFVIERTVPGIGGLPLETQKQLSAGSNAALEQVGAGIEWVRSYLTDEGTYCVYRAVDTDKIIEHGRISEFPIDTIKAVEHSTPIK